MVDVFVAVPAVGPAAAGLVALDVEAGWVTMFDDWCDADAVADSGELIIIALWVAVFGVVRIVVCLSAPLLRA